MALAWYRMFRSLGERLALAVVLIGTLLTAGVWLHVRDQRGRIRAAIYDQVALGLAETGANLAWHDLRRQCGEPESPLSKLLIEGSLSEAMGAPLTLALDTDLHSRAFRLLTGECDLAVEARVKLATPLLATRSRTQVYDPLEKRLTVEVVSKAHYRGAEGRVCQERVLRVQTDTTPVVSKFTLFIKNPEADGDGAPGYNRFANDINGAAHPLARDNRHPLILFNHGDDLVAGDRSVAERGFVFLGGQAPVTLNLTAGGHHTNGEAFHLAKGSPVFVNDSPPSPILQGGRHQYRIEHALCGYFAADGGNPPSSMNARGMLQAFFDSGRTTRSSVLHLFGNAICPSATMVFGNVFHSYAIYSSIAADDGLVTLLPALEEPLWPSLPVLAPLPSYMDTADGQGRLSGYGAIFGNYATYAAYMSLVVTQEAYNAGVTYMRATGRFPPESLSRDQGAVLPDPGTTMKIRRQNETGPSSVYFRGDLNEVDSTLLRSRAFVSFDSPERLLEAIIRQEKLVDLGCHAHVKGGDLALPADLIVRLGGAILCEGSISFDGLTCQAGQRLALVSLQGDVTSPFRHSSERKPAQADLIALGGRVACTDSQRRVNVRGVVAARLLRPDDVPAGGRVVYPIEADPTSPQRRDFVRLFLADRAKRWRY